MHPMDSITCRGGGAYRLENICTKEIEKQCDNAY
jgi:hypothetical protein